MAENITTLLELLEAGTLNDDDVIYIVHGSGSDRDRKLKLSRLQQHCAKVLVDETDEIPRFLIDKFSTSSNPEFRHGDVRFFAVNTRGGREVSTEIRDKTITKEKLADKCVTGEKIADGTITSDKIWNVRGDNIDFNICRGSKSVTIDGDGSAGTTTVDIATFNAVFYRGFYDLTVGFKNISTYPLSHAVIKLIDQKGNLVDSYDFSGYTDQQWHQGRMTGRYTSVYGDEAYNLFLKLEADKGFAGSRSPQVSWCGFTIE